METESEGVRVCEVPEITEVLTDRGMAALLERIRDLGGVEGDKDDRENEDRGAGVGELLSLADFPVGLLGELVDLEGGEAAPVVRDVDVA